MVHRMQQCFAVADVSHAQPTAHSMLATAGPPLLVPKAAVSVGGSASSDMRYVPAHRAAARTAAVISLQRQSTRVRTILLFAVCL